MSTCKPRQQCLIALLAVVFLLPAGCKKKSDPQVFVSAQSALTAGMEAFENKDYQTAVSHMDVAITQRKGLLPDLYCRALLTRAESNARLGNFPLAHADLDTAARGADMAEVHRLRSYVYKQEGKSAQSADEYKKAKQFNREIKPIKD